MINYPVNSTDLRLLFPEVIELETEYFYRAREIGARETEEAQQWQTYLNVLALQSLEQWLNSRLPDRTIAQDEINTVCYLKVGEFKIYVIATEHLLDEIVNIPESAIKQPEKQANFYVLLEVLEEQQQVILRGMVRREELVDYCTSNQALSPQGYYQLPLALFDAEPNHLLFYFQFTEPTTIPLPVAATEGNFLVDIKQNRTKLTQWLQKIFDETWLSIDMLINPEANLALSTRNAELGVTRGKIIDFQMQLSSQTLALLVTIAPDAEGKLGVSIQLHPTGRNNYLPPNLNLNLLSKAGKIIQEVTSRSEDNYILLLPFRGEAGKHFSIEVSLNDLILTEDFEL